MSNPLHVLIVEDSESDAAMVVHLLRKAGYDIHDQRVESADQMQAALEKQAWDVVIADYSLPQFDAPAALALLQQTGLDIPFIVVSGTIGEETAVTTMKAGAHDYLMKNKLTRLAPAVEREIREAQMRQERKRGEEALRESEVRFRSYVENAPMAIFVYDQQGRYIDFNLGALKMLGYDIAAMSSMSIEDIALEEDHTILRQSVSALRSDGHYECEMRQKRADGNVIWISMRAV